MSLPLPADAMPDMIALPGGSFRMGSDRHYPEEAPARDVTVAPFRVARTPTTNRQFAAFVAATGYVTTSERDIDPGEFPELDASQLKAGALVFRPLERVPSHYDWRLWWRYKRGASWRRPEGGRTIFAGRLDHPVVCVSYADAQAYAAWAGLRLPTEIEWEFAARGGASGDYPWGDELAPGGATMANTWSGKFPIAIDKGKAVRTTRVGSFPANDYGLVDVVGNVWEWTSDVFDEAPTKGCCGGEAVDRAYVVKGGSFLCAPDYCARYRPAARQPQTPETAAGHIGFRCAKTW